MSPDSNKNSFSQFLSKVAEVIKPLILGLRQWFDQKRSTAPTPQHPNPEKNDISIPLLPKAAPSTINVFDRDSTNPELIDFKIDQTHSIDSQFHTPVSFSSPIMMFRPVSRNSSGPILPPTPDSEEFYTPTGSPPQSIKDQNNKRAQESSPPPSSSPKPH